MCRQRKKGRASALLKIALRIFAGTVDNIFSMGIPLIYHSIFTELQGLR